jgi:hypothetical protein
MTEGTDRSQRELMLGISGKAEPEICESDLCGETESAASLGGSVKPVAPEFGSLHSRNSEKKSIFTKPLEGQRKLLVFMAVLTEERAESIFLICKN